MFIGRIDLKIYSVVFPQITTDEVILTPKQSLHMQIRHPDCWEEVKENLSRALAQPDYILRDASFATAVVLKKIWVQGRAYRVILRLATPSDPAEYKNSIITAFEISEKKWNKYLRNKQILYKRE